LIPASVFHGLSHNSGSIFVPANDGALHLPVPCPADFIFNYYGQAGLLSNSATVYQVTEFAEVEEQ
jgi:hypothetical protein